jgi:hypothetical protein
MMSLLNPNRAVQDISLRRATMVLRTPQKFDTPRDTVHN